MTMRTNSSQNTTTATTVKNTREQPQQQPLLLVGTPMVLRKKKKKIGICHDGMAKDRAGTEYVQFADQIVDMDVIATTSVLNDSHGSGENNPDPSATTTTNSGGGVSAVLHGEERYEVLSVPTCMYQQPYPVSVWIDADARTVRLQTTRTKAKCHNNPTDDDDHDDRRTMSPHSIVSTINDDMDDEMPDPNGTFRSFYQEEQEDVLTVPVILQALRAAVKKSSSPQSSLVSSMLLRRNPIQQVSSSSSFSLQTNNVSTIPTAATSTVGFNSKQRILHAVLLKWKVIMTG
jgi:hypothetical protein